MSIASELIEVCNKISEVKEFKAILASAENTKDGKIPKGTKVRVRILDDGSNGNFSIEIISPDGLSDVRQFDTVKELDSLFKDNVKRFFK